MIFNQHHLALQEYRNTSLHDLFEILSGMYNHYKPGSVCKRFLTERRKTYSHTNRQTYRQTDRQRDRQKTGSETDTNIVIQTHICKQF